MATVQECLDAMVVAGRLAREDAEEAMAFVRRQERAYAETMTRTEAEIAAAEKALEILAHRAATKRRQDALQVLRSKQNAADLAAHPKGETAGALAKLVKDRHGVSGYDNVHGLWRGYEGFFHGRFADAMDRLRPKYLGVKKETARAEEMIFGLYGRRPVRCQRHALLRRSPWAFNIAACSN